MEQDIKKLIEELTKVRPDELSTDGLKLFNKINEIIDKNKELEELKDNKVLIRRYFDLKDNSIPVSLVEEKIGENNKLIEECKKDEEHYGEIYIYEHDNKVLQELLERWK